jgi:methionine-rich copper-binding protein CopC
MPANEIHLNDVGTKFLVTIKDGSSAVNISSASTKEIIIQKPSGTKITATATFDSDGTDGKIYYVTVADDLDEAGSYKLQGKVIISDGTFYTDITSFKVHRNL